jgi:DNA-binding SARP family transcriptional activator
VIRAAHAHPVSAPAGLRLELLDGFRLHLDDAEVPLPRAVQRLIAFLAIHRRPLQRVFVAGSLWLDSDEEHATANLRTALWRLGSVGAPMVETSRTQLALAHGVVVDLHESTARARQLLFEDGAKTIDEHDAARLDCDLLPDWYDDWLLIERERYRQLRLHALEAICQALAATDSYGPAVEAGLACVAAEPLRESAHRALIEIHLSEGNRGEALRAYRLYRKIVLEQLGLVPSPAMQQMVRSLAIGVETGDAGHAGAGR